MRTTSKHPTPPVSYKQTVMEDAAGAQGALVKKIFPIRLWHNNSPVT